MSFVSSRVRRLAVPRDADIQWAELISGEAFVGQRLNNRAGHELPNEAAGGTGEEGASPGG